MAVSKRTRFEVFKRDGFKCQYCGKCAPDVVLEVDHIEPKAKGGKDSIINLVTACRDCNGGKSDIRLDDNAAISKERLQLQELNERREQLEMMLKWKRGLLELDRDSAQAAVDHFCDLFDCTVESRGTETIRKLVKHYGLSKVIDSIEIAADQYSSAEKAFSKLGGILHIRKKAERDPYYESVCRIKGKMKYLGFYINDREAEQLIRDVLATGKFDFDSISDFTSRARNWTEWKAGMVASIK